MQFSQPSPGLLAVVGAEWVGYWSLGDVTGITQGQAASWIADALNDPRGWGRAGVRFQQVAFPGGAVAIHVVDTIPGSPGIIGLATHYADGSCRVLLEAGQYANPDLVNHEIAHAFFFAEHSPEGSDSIEEPLEELGTVEWPSDLDISQLIAWLGPAPAPPLPPPPEPERYFFPGNLDTYITNWYIPSGARVRVTCTVRDPAPGIIRPVCADTHAHMLSGERQVLCGGLSTDAAGWHKTEWQDANRSGDLYVAFIVEVEAGVSIDELNIAHAEVQLSGTGDDGTRDIPN